MQGKVPQCNLGSNLEQLCGISEVNHKVTKVSKEKIHIKP